jgi:ATP-dependent exoDNAse (exonuclease V) alpha subunit
MQAQRAVTWARDHVFERSAVQDRRAILETALVRGMGETTYARIQQEFERRIEAGEFREVSHVGAGRQYTTAVMIRMEREIVGRMQEGNRRDYSDPMLVSPQMRIATEDRHPELNASQRQAVDEILLSREKVVGLDGIAGAGKTTTLSVIREGAEAEGYKVEGFAPTSRAAQKLGEAGMETSTLQKHLVRGQQPDSGEKRLYVLDESSLASTRQVHEFVNRLHPNDRVLLVGDRRQHEAVEAGRPFAQLQDAGMKTVKLEEIVRQKDPELKQVVEQLARGEVREAIQNLDRQGRVHEIQGHDERIAAIAKDYAKSPENTLVISPDNSSRIEINERIHAELQRSGLVSSEEHRIRTLVPRQNLTGADRTWAERYEVGDVLRYSRASKETGIGKGEYAQVKSIDAPKNRLTVELQDGTERTYDPRRQQGVSVFREEMRSFSVGDRVQFTAPASDLRVANRELGTIKGIDEDGRLCMRMDGGRTVELDTHKHPHLDHGYAMTSHSSQGQTADRVLIHVDTELGAKDLLNSRMAYVSVSRGAHDAQLFTNDREQLPATLGHDVSQQSTHVPEIKPNQTIAPQQEASQGQRQDHGMGLGIGF